MSFRVPAGKTVALVGESGSGKTVISQSHHGPAAEAGSVTGGRILFNDPKSRDAAGRHRGDCARDGREIRALRGGRIGMIFQEPMTSLSPVHTIGNQIAEALRLHRPVPHGEARDEVRAHARPGRLQEPEARLQEYPFELSGGLRQRAMLAMALICRPALLIADEPTTALDVTIQAQILKLMRDLQRELGMAILMITHDLGVVANMADEVVVMYHGEIIEAGTAYDIFRRPQHPYLRALLQAVPRFDMKPGERLVAMRDSGADLPRPRRRCARPTADQRQARRCSSIRNLRKAYTSRASGWLGGAATASSRSTT